MKDSGEIKNSLSKFISIRDKKHKFLLISGLSAIAGVAGIFFQPLYILTVIGSISYWVIFRQITKMNCPNCDEHFGIGKESIIGNGITSCYHCGLCLDGTFVKKPDSHGKEWLEY